MNTINCEECRILLINEGLLSRENNSYCLKNSEKQSLQRKYEKWKNINRASINSSELREKSKKLKECVKIILRENKCDVLLCIEETEGEYKYTFEQKLGEGTFGEVWKAKSKFRNNEPTDVVIKVFKDISEQGTFNMTRECECLEKIKPVCQEYGVCLEKFYTTLDGKSRLVMEYIEGDDLRKWEKKELSERKNLAMKIIEDLCYGLEKIHQHNISHQDIKSNNIIYDTKKNRFRYIDWGLCCVPRNQQRGYINNCGSIGTVYITSPELEIRKSADGNYNTPDITNQNYEDMKAHDIWSLGIVFLRFITNTPEENELYPEYFKKTPTEILNIASRSGDSFITNIIVKMLEMDPKKRIENFSYILNSLQVRTIILKVSIYKVQQFVVERIQQLPLIQLTRHNPQSIIQELAPELAEKIKEYLYQKRLVEGSSQELSQILFKKLEELLIPILQQQLAEEQARQQQLAAQAEQARQQQLAAQLAEQARQQQLAEQAEQARQQQLAAQLAEQTRQQQLAEQLAAQTRQQQLERQLAAQAEQARQQQLAAQLAEQARQQQLEERETIQDMDVEIVYGRMDQSLLTNMPSPDPVGIRSFLRCGNNSSCNSGEEMSIN